MTKAAVLVLAGTESHADRGRVLNALETAKEFEEAEGDEVALIFDGAAAQWVPELEAETHDFHELYTSIKTQSSVCAFCAGAFGVEDAVGASEAVLVEENNGHPSIQSLVADGYEVITF